VAAGAPVVRVDRLTKAYGARPPALTDVTLEFGEGITGLLGPNGAGKSTLLQCVLGLLRDFHGEANVLGLDARRDRLEIRRRVGYMPESDSLLPDMTAVTSVRYLGQLTGMSRRHALRRAHECLHYVGLTEALYRPAEEFSTGMRQRLKLAQALVHDPDLLFLDEPVSGMDPKGREDFLELIRQLAKDHAKHVVWSSHMLPDVQKVARQVLILDKGRLKGSFRLEDLHGATGRFDVEADGDVESFERAVGKRGFAIVSGAAASETAESGTAALAEDGLPRFRRVVRGGAAEPTTALLAAGRDAGVRVRRVAAVVESLEDVFHRLLAARPDTGPEAAGRSSSGTSPGGTGADGPDARLFP
jgi:ABC-2 type transport system ATP-binding protein